jgi:HEAT repeat protein
VVENDRGSVHQQALEALVDLRAREVVPTLRAMIDPKDSWVDTAVFRALSQLGDRSLAPFFVDLLRRSSGGRKELFEGLARLDAKDAAPAIAEFLDHEDEGVREAAVRALGTLRAREWTPKILARFRDPSSDVRLAAVEAAATLGGAEAVAALMSVVEDDHLYTRREALQGLARLGAKEVVPVVLRNLHQDEDVMKQADAVRAAAKLGLREAVPRMEALLARNDYSRWAVLPALGALGARESVPCVTKFLSGTWGELRHTTARTLLELGCRDGAPPLLEDGACLFTLNVLRRPDLLARLRSRRITGSLSGCMREDLERLAGQAGLRLRTSLPPLALDYDWTPRTNPVWWTHEPPSLADVLAEVLEFDYDVVLEDDGLRILPRDEARRFWEAWLGSR